MLTASSWKRLHLFVFQLCLHKKQEGIHRILTPHYNKLMCACVRACMRVCVCVWMFIMGLDHDSQSSSNVTIPVQLVILDWLGRYCTDTAGFYGWTEHWDCPQSEHQHQAAPGTDHRLWQPDPLLEWSESLQNIVVSSGTWITNKYIFLFFLLYIQHGDFWKLSFLYK